MPGEGHPEIWRNPVRAVSMVGTQSPGRAHLEGVQNGQALT